MKKITLDSRYCPWCAEIRSKYWERAEIYRLITGEEEVGFEGSKHYATCPFHRVFDWIKYQRFAGKKIFKVEEGAACVRVTIGGYSNKQEKAIEFEIYKDDKEATAYVEGIEVKVPLTELLMILDLNELRKLSEVVTNYVKRKPVTPNS